MKIAGFKSERAEPVRRKAELLAEQNVVVIRRGRGTCGRKRGLLHEIVLRVIAIERSAEKPLRVQGLRPIETRGEKRVTKRDRDICGNGNGRQAWYQAVGGELRERVEL